MLLSVSSGHKVRLEEFGDCGKDERAKRMVEQRFGKQTIEQEHAGG